MEERIRKLNKYDNSSHFNKKITKEKIFLYIYSIYTRVFSILFIIYYYYYLCMTTNDTLTDSMQYNW